VLITCDDERARDGVVDVDTMTNTDYRMRQYLSLFISDCQEII
jgi:hypothetical protein